MARRVVVALIGPVRWAPPGIEPAAWRAALAEDVVDLLATMNEVEPAIAAVAADRPLADAVAWPGMPIYDLPARDVNAALAAAARDGFEQAAVITTDAPDVPGLILGKLLRPLTTRPLAVAPAEGGGGLLGVASRLPVPDWLPPVDLDTADPAAVRAAAPRPADVVVTPAWRRLRGPADLATLDPAVEGWDSTRLLLSP
ncbi:hypothetical protein [Polymorphospora sp. NPDC050346]|uniref:hypothetical protein n=1 Tax=Polymorphospora sp. NPDC050346 TaxID=3155780 RepID=UPI0033F44196